jgi:flagellar protein FliS
LSAPVAAHTAAYRQQSILTATPGQLVVMLYDGCLRFLRQSAHALREEQPDVAQVKWRRADAILGELLSTLDLEQGGEIASRLQGIYVFCQRHLLEAVRDQEPAKVEKVIELLSELRESWVQIAAA